MTTIKKYIYFISLFFTALISCEELVIGKKPLVLNELGYYEQPGLNVLVFSNWYNGLFSDSKMSGIEIIHHEVRTATNGDVRIDRTPEQWDAIPTFVERKIDSINQSIEAYLKYPDYDFDYMVKSEVVDDGILISVNINKALPDELIGRAGFNLEFLPSAYFEKSFLIDGKPGGLPLYPNGSMEYVANGTTPKPLASGNQLVMAPEDQERRISIESTDNKLSLYDGRNKAQNGWFVLQSLIPANKTGRVIEWKLTASTKTNWLREPVIGHSQVGYHPDQKKVAVIELDKNDELMSVATLYKIDASGNYKKLIVANTDYYGKYNRYQYATFDFSEVSQEGVYVLEYNNTRTEAFSISKDIYASAWHATSDVYFPVQMDHMTVNEAYRIWHGKSHMDDALQAPVDHPHFDLYGQGASTDTPYKPGEHIPGLNIGGWYDAGDYDIRTQTQYRTVQTLVQAWEDFKPERDETHIDQKAGYVDIHKPDGKADILQQIEHGTLALIAQHRAVGHAIPGIIVPHISQYTHLGDGMTMTDNLIYNPKMDSFQTDGFRSGIFDDRWAFTSRSSALNYGSIASLTAASRALKGYNDALSKECLNIAIKSWDEEQSKEPDLFRVGNTTGGRLNSEMFKAAVELLETVGGNKYKKVVYQLWPEIRNRFSFNVSMTLKAMPYMDEVYQSQVKEKALAYKQRIDSIKHENPYGVPITRGGWAGNGTVIRFGINNYLLGKAFPDLFSIDHTIRALNYLYGTHPGSDISFVSAVGTKSKKVAYGMNRADYSFIAGGIVPGVLILPPDFPENKEDWPFLWGENEYVINLGASYIYLVHAANDLLN